MKVLIALIMSFGLCHAKDILIADSFEFTFPDDSIPTYIPTEGNPNKALPSVRNNHFQFWSYRWDWINKEQNLENIPKLLEKKNRNFDCRISEIRNLETRDGLSGVMFHREILRENRLPVHSENLLLRTPSGRTLLFQMTGDRDLVEQVFSSARFK